MAINQRGDAAGFLNRSAADGSSLRPVAAWWTHKGTLHRLDPPPGFAFGQALGINVRRHIVGVAYSTDFSKCTARLWKHDEAIKIQSRSVGIDGDLCSANDINDSGHITGQASDRATNASLTFVAKPLRRN